MTIVVLDAQVLEQRLVGELVDARLVAAQVDRHAVGHFVVERLEHPLAGRHGLARSFDLCSHRV